MSPENRVEIVGCQFIVVDSSNEIVGRYASEEEAQQTIEECKKEDEGWETAPIVGEERNQGIHAIARR
jgi:hypothetical protein